MVPGADRTGTTRDVGIHSSPSVGVAFSTFSSRNWATLEDKEASLSLDNFNGWLGGKTAAGGENCKFKLVVSHVNKRDILRFA